jgi:hypothetical protein
MPSSDTATDFASNGEISKSDGAMKTAEPAAPHASGNGAASGPEMPNPTFLWKPSSDSDGNLVILLPAGMTGQVAELEVMSPDGKTVLAKGKYTGAGNGMREHYRFGKPGASFHQAQLQVTMTNGTQKEIKIRIRAAVWRANSFCWGNISTYEIFWQHTRPLRFGAVAQQVPLL